MLMENTTGVTHHSLFCYYAATFEESDENLDPQKLPKWHKQLNKNKSYLHIDERITIAFSTIQMARHTACIEERRIIIEINMLLFVYTLGNLFDPHSYVQN